MIKKYLNSVRVDKYERKRIAAQIFLEITRNWQGVRMTFPLPGGRLAVIEGSEIMAVIEKALVRSLGQGGSK